MKMENTITATAEGYVNNLIAATGENIAANTVLLDVVAEPVASTSQKNQNGSKVTGPTKVVTVPMPGKILDIQVSPGDKIKPGQVVLILEAMKMENSITAEVGGTVNEIFVEVGETVSADTKVLDLAEV